MNTSLRILSFAALVVSVLTPGAGCYSSMPITDPSEGAGHALLVKTNGLYTYELDRWEVLENQDIVGAGMRQEDVLGILRPAIIRNHASSEHAIGERNEGRAL